MEPKNTGKNPRGFFNIIEDYFERMLEEVPGMKGLILDEETKGIISLIVSQSQILKKNVYHMEVIDRASSEKLLHLNSVFFIRPTEENINKIVDQVKSLDARRFNEYNLFFSNSLLKTHLEQLAELDTNNLIKKVVEVFVDYYAVNDDLFTLNLPRSLTFAVPKELWSPVEEKLFQRMSNGLLAAIYSKRTVPMIKYQATSEVCADLAKKINDEFMKEYSENSTSFKRDREAKLAVIIIDRREDPVTPLLNQWTYQAMVHELVGLTNNRVELAKDKQKSKEKEGETEYVLSSHDDKFFRENMYADFGVLANNTNLALNEYSEYKKKHEKIETLEQMQKVLDSIPELRQKSGNVSKHVTLTCELSKLVEERDLMEISKIEQEIACKDNKNEHFRMVSEILGKNFDKVDKLRLVILFALRYETDTTSISALVKKLRDSGIPDEYVGFVSQLLDFAGKKERSGDLFGNKDATILKFTSKMKNMLVMKNVPNVYTQHQPYIVNILASLFQGKLRENEYKTTNLHSFFEKPEEVIIFIVGGATYEEARFINQMSQDHRVNISLGGTTILNSKLFLAEVAEWNKLNKARMSNFNNPDSSPEQSAAALYKPKGTTGFYKMT